MSDARVPSQGPTWRQPRAAPFEHDRAFVACRCGVDMEFVWPRSADSVRCFGCGASFPRPGHLPPPLRVTWSPDAPPAPRQGALRRHLPLLALVLLAGALLGLGLGLVLGRQPGPP